MLKVNDLLLKLNSDISFSSLRILAFIISEAYDRKSATDDIYIKLSDVSPDKTSYKKVIAAINTELIYLSWSDNEQTYGVFDIIEKVHIRGCSYLHAVFSEQVRGKFPEFASFSISKKSAVKCGGLFIFFTIIYFTYLKRTNAKYIYIEKVISMYHKINTDVNFSVKNMKTTLFNRIKHAHDMGYVNFAVECLEAEDVSIHERRYKIKFSTNDADEYSLQNKEEENTNPIINKTTKATETIETKTGKQGKVELSTLKAISLFSDINISYSLLHSIKVYDSSIGDYTLVALPLSAGIYMIEIGMDYYIGKAKSLRDRIRQHISNCTLLTEHSPEINDAIRRSERIFSIYILKDNVSYNKLNEVESIFIRTLKPSLNTQLV